MEIKKGTFITLDFTGYTEEGNVFDTTNKAIAEKNGLIQKNVNYEPITICLGEGHLLKGLDKAIEGHKPNEKIEVKLEPEDAFGKKRADLLKLMPINVFKKQNIKPMPGLEVSIDNMRGLIKTVSGNRVVVDFNNPLANQKLKYDIQLHEIVEDKKKQIETVVGMALHFAPQVTLEEEKATIGLPVELPDDLKKQLREKVVELVKVKELNFSVTKPQS